VLDVIPPFTDNDKEVIKVVLRERAVALNVVAMSPRCWPLSGQRKNDARALLGFFWPLVGVPDDEQCGDD
jgi:hypothetical protein